MILFLEKECRTRRTQGPSSKYRAAPPNVIKDESYLDHYHAERNHQGLCNQLIEPSDDVGKEMGRIKCRDRLGGMLRYYYRVAG